MSIEILQLLQQDNHAITRNSAGELHGPCPWCGGDDRFMVFPETDKYYCRQCNARGDAIQYLREYRHLDYFQAAGIVGNQIPARQKGSSPHRKTTAGQGWAENAAKLVKTATSYLQADPHLRAELLRSRGITAETIALFNLGWLPRNIFAERSGWGLAAAFKEDGTPKRLFVPEGLVVPSLDMKRIRIRRSDPGQHRKYFEVPGSDDTPMIINGHLGTDIAAAIVVESELDAILLAQELKVRNVIIATGGASNGPTDEMIADLSRRPFVLVAFDNDRAGGRAAWERWMSPLRNAVRAAVPPSMGKDITEAHLAGLDLNVWFSAGCNIVMELCHEVAA